MDNQASVLIVDDRIRLCESLAASLTERGYHCLSASSGEKALSRFKTEGADAILLDIMLGEENGLDLIPQFLSLKPSVPIIVITGYGTVESAVSAIKVGAFDYIQKPIKTEKLLKVLENALRIVSLEKENRNFKGLDVDDFPATQSPAMRQVLSNLRRLAASNLPILICGESGTGKDMIADFIHRNSPRASRPIVKVNCAAFPESLLDNELFGHERGAYTGANVLFRGVFERSHEGSLFLDEIGDMPLSIQTKILRAIQNKEIRRIGGSETIYVDIRFIAATNQNLDSLVVAGTFRNDLLYRLNTATVVIPPLRERKEDIPLMVSRFLSAIAAQNQVPSKHFSTEAMSCLLNYPWPGNVRELKSAIEYAFTLSSDSEILLSDLPLSVKEESVLPSGMCMLDSVEREMVEKTLRSERFNKTAAAARLGMSRATLYNKMRKYGIDG